MFSMACDDRGRVRAKLFWDLDKWNGFGQYFQVVYAVYAVYVQ